MHTLQAMMTEIFENHRHFERIGSTNSQLLADIGAGVLDPCSHHLYTADEQTAGRGQHSRSWVSGAGNVFLSLYTPMRRFARCDGLERLSGLLSLSVGLSLSQMACVQRINAVSEPSMPSVGVKWANDLGFYDDGQLFNKLAGILIEPVYALIDGQMVCAGVITGVGLNVASAPMIRDGLYRATCLADLYRLAQLGEPPTARMLFAPMCQAICQAVLRCNTLADGEAMTQFVTQFDAAHLLTDMAVQIFIRDEMDTAAHSGVCVGISEQGALLLENDGKVQPIFAGMVQRAKCG